MIRGLKSLGNIHGPEDACEAAGRLDILAGGTKGADLVFTGLLEAGESTAVYLFRQQFEGAEGLTEDRVLKIAVNAAGQPEAVFSSLSPAPPEFPEGDLSPITGEDQDPEESEAAAQRVVYPPEQTFDYMERQQWTGTVTGGLTFDHLKDIRMATSIRVNGVEAFNTEDLHRVIHEIHDLSEKTKNAKSE